eukprot:4781442-Pyramimonas_sp.AAC.1
MAKVCQALHEGTEYAAHVAGGQSLPWLPDRGLREGCPSSPPIFNIYRDAVMEDFRARREQAAQEQNVDAGIRWYFRVNEDLVKRCT